MTAQKKTTYYLLAATLCFLIGVVISLFVTSKSNSQIEPVVLPIAVQPSVPSNTRILTLCELGEDAYAKSGKEVLVVSTFIGKMSADSFSLLSECGTSETVTARVTLKGIQKIPEPQLVSLVELMTAHGENTQSEAGQVIIYGRADTDRDLALGEDFHIEASDVRVQMNSAPAHNKRLERTRRE